ncbi:hypothetical protein CYL31_20695 [Marinomonas sp. A3A]|jgi:hypothetical protein|uniref:DUF6795 domain-containing protein n=1 Tax=Marinomonas sp. A3A TaxID=2065312 RepID=UPI001BB3A675|nr:DUF6795 domain-containing protein [Marinomonas sp. A3A]QUX93678.1 hypothetical protein CYL31_20695 [Marinomonas sp. A3A]
MVSFFGLKRYDVELSPPVKGRITDNGKPVAGIEVERRLFYSGYSKEAIFDYATTNADGEFSFEEKIVKSRAPGDIFGQNALIFQDISIKNKLSYDNEPYWIWLIRKDFSPYSKLNNLMLNLNADLKNKEVQHEIDLSKNGGMYNQPIVSICYFKDELITTYYNSKIIKSYEEIK